MIKRAYIGSSGLLLSVACSSGGHRASDEGLDYPGNPTRDAATESEARTSNVDASTHDGSADAGVVSDESANSSALDARVTDPSDDTDTSSFNPFHDRDGSVPDPPLDGASLIIEPDVQTIDVAALCDAVLELQGQIIHVNLAVQVTLGAWSEVQEFATVGDGGLDASAVADAAVGIDSQVCTEKFAPYLIACGQGAIVVQSPSMVYGTGPQLGGEPVGLGCWERECTVQCLPADVSELSLVQAQLSPVVPTTAPEGGVQGLTGFVRLNGVDVEAIATLDITGRL